MSRPAVTRGQIFSLLNRALEEGAPKEVIERLQWFLYYLDHRSISATCRNFSIARTTFYRWFKRFDPEDLTTLIDTPTVRPFVLPERETQRRPLEQGVRFQGEEKESTTSAKHEEVRTFFSSFTEDTPSPEVRVPNPEPCRHCLICRFTQFLKPYVSRLTFFLVLVSLFFHFVLLLLLFRPLTAEAASSWNPTLLVNTESFNVIDDGDGTTNIYLKFGDSLAETLTWDRTDTRFEFSDDVGVSGDLEVTGTASGKFVHAENLLTSSGGLAVDTFVSAEGNIVINADNTAADAVLTFGNALGGTETLLFSNGNGRFEFTDDVYVSGTFTTTSTLTVGAYTLPATDGDNGQVLKSNGAGVLSWQNDSTGVGALTAAEAFDWFVDTKGDTMTGSLTVANGKLITASGAIRTETGIILNFENAAGDATLSFGNQSGREFIRFNDTTDRFELSDDINVTGTISASTLTTAGELVYSNGTTLAQTTATTSGSVLVTQTTNAPEWKVPTTAMVWYIDDDLTVNTSQGAVVTMPYGMTVTDIDLNVRGAPTGAAVIIDINDDGTTIYSTRPQINASATTEAGTEALSDTNLEKGSVVTLDIDQVGSTFAGSGLTVILQGTRKY